MYILKTILLLTALLTLISCKSTDEVRSVQELLKHKGMYSVTDLECVVNNKEDGSVDNVELITTIKGKNGSFARLSSFTYRLSYGSQDDLIIDEENFKQYSDVEEIMAMHMSKNVINIRLPLKKFSHAFRAAPVKVAFRGVVMNSFGFKLTEVKAEKTL